MQAFKTGMGEGDLKENSFLIYGLLGFLNA